MGAKVVTDQQAGFGSGVNPVSDPAFLRPDQAMLMNNFRLSNYGAALKRLGTVLATTDAVSAFVPENQRGNGIYWPSKDLICLVTADAASPALTLYTTTYTIPIPATFTPVSALPQWRPVLFTDETSEIIYWAGDATQPVYKFDGATVSSLGAATAKVDGVCVYNDRLWGWHGTSLYFSDLSSTVGGTGGDTLGDVANGGGQIIVRTFGDSDIVACRALNGNLIIWHRRGMSILTGWGQDDIQVLPQVLNATIGLASNTEDALCVANTVSAGDVAYFLSDVGVFETNGAYVKPLGTPERPDPVAYGLLNNLWPPTKSILTFNRRANELWVGGGTDDSVVGTYIYNIILGAWSGPFDEPYARRNHPFEVIDPQGHPWVWMLSYPNADGDLHPYPNTQVILCDLLLGTEPEFFQDYIVLDGSGGSSGGVPVIGILEFRRMFCGDRSYAKSFRWVNILATLAEGDTPPVLVSRTSLGGTIARAFSGLSDAEKVYYLSPGGSGPFIDLYIQDVCTLVATQYTLATVQGNLLGQR